MNQVRPTLAEVDINNVIRKTNIKFFTRSQSELNYLILRNSQVLLLAQAIFSEDHLKTFYIQLSDNNANLFINNALRVFKKECEYINIEEINSLNELHAAYVHIFEIHFDKIFNFKPLRGGKHFPSCLELVQEVIERYARKDWLANKVLPQLLKFKPIVENYDQTYKDQFKNKFDVLNNDEFI